MKVKFIKMEALANDFIFIDALENKGFKPNLLLELAFDLCNRRRGIGADGVIFIDASKSGKGENQISIRVFNADGTEAENCGNGLRCAARYAYDQVYTKGKREFEILLEKSKRKVTAFVDEDDITVDMGQAIMESEGTINFNGSELNYTLMNIGNPHAVIFLKDIEELDLKELANAFEKDGRFIAGVNINLASFTDSKNLNLRIWERGVGESPACGTGACSSVALGIKKGLCENSVTVNMLGGKAKLSQRGSSMFLTGPVNYVFKGEI
jgi:diaminopimelate epimerase